MKLFGLACKNLLRNKTRSVLTALAVAVLVIVFSMIFTVLRFLDRAMEAKSTDIPVVITERFRIPSRFNRSLLDLIVKQSSLHSELMNVPGFDPEKYTLWHFMGFTTDEKNLDKDRQFFAIATLPEKMPIMIDGLEEFDPQLCELMKNPPRTRLAHAGMLMGPDRLARLGKKVGDQLTAYSFSHRTASGGLLKMEFEIVGELPAASRWAQGAFIDYAYVDRILKEEKNPLDGTINLGWLKVGDQESAARVGATIESYIKEVKVETASTAVSRFLAGYQDILFGVKYMLAPAIIVVMVVIVANAVAISVRERTAEMAVLKVLGFRPNQIMLLVLGEGLLLGALAGLGAAAFTYLVVNVVMGGINVPIGFFPVFFVPVHVFWWGPVLGGLSALAGGYFPAMAARSIKVSEVFSKVT
ncbi:MAG: FtsX-like permease family protein [Gemmataceae bacterium]